MDAANVVLDDSTITSHIKRLRRKFLEIDQRVRCRSNRLRNGLSLGRVSIRLQLLIVALTTLILPWAGCQYARELEKALRVSQENALESTADTIALALSAQPAGYSAEPRTRGPMPRTRGICMWYALAQPPLLDGYHEDWGVMAPIRNACRARTAMAARLQAGQRTAICFIYVEVDEPHFVAGARQSQRR